LLGVPEGKRAWFVSAVDGTVLPTNYGCGDAYFYATREDAEAWRGFDRANRAGGVK